MINVAFNNHDKAKLQFYAAYVASIILVLTIFMLFWKDNSGSSSAAAAERTTPSTDRYVKTAAFLHGLLKEQESLFTTALNSDTALLVKLPVAMKTAQAVFDSVVTNTAMNNDQQKAEFRQLYDDVQQLLQSRNKAIQDFLLVKQNENNLAVSGQQNTQQIGAVSPSEANQLVQEKEQQIALLEKQLLEERADKERRVAEMRSQLSQNQQAAAGRTTPNNDEWKKKYSYVKARHGELNTAYNALSQAYQNVVADNKRLYGHIKILQKQ